MISSSSRRVVRGGEGTDVLRGEREEKKRKGFSAAAAAAAAAGYSSSIHHLTVVASLSLWSLSALNK